MLREWLRSWLGWDGLVAQIDANAKLIAALSASVIASEKEIKALKHQRERREQTNSTIQVTDWETIQAEYSANPENYKES